MANLNDREDLSNLSNQPPRTTNPEVAGENHVVHHSPASHQDGYVQGRAVEQHRNAVNQEIRDNDNAGRGLLVGIILTSLIGLTAGGLYLLNQRNQTPATIDRTIVVPRPAPSQSPQVRERVIERERIVPVPQQPQPAAAPNVNVTVPQQPAPAAPTQSAPAAPAAPAQSNPQPVTPNNSSQPNSSSEPPTNNAEPNSSGANSGSNSGSAGTGSN